MASHIVITRCPDSLMWYAGKVGHIVPLVRDLPSDGSYLSREPSGLTNIVRHEDAIPLPAGFAAAAADTRVQLRDLILLDGRWACPSLADIGRPSTDFVTIRKAA